MQVRSPSQKVRRYSSNGAFINRSTVDWVETNGQAAVLILRDGVPIGLTIDASAQGINEIMWFLRPSKLAAVSKSI